MTKQLTRRDADVDPVEVAAVVERGGVGDADGPGRS